MVAKNRQAPLKQRQALAEFGLIYPDATQCQKAKTQAKVLATVGADRFEVFYSLPKQRLAICAPKPEIVDKVHCHELEFMCLVVCGSVTPCQFQVSPLCVKFSQGLHLLRAILMYLVLCHKLGEVAAVNVAGRAFDFWQRGKAFRAVLPNQFV